MEQIVPGDIVNVEAGDLVPADGRIIRAATLEIDESALTGESAPVPKQVDAVAADAAARRPRRHGVHEHPGHPRRGDDRWSPRPAWRPRSATSRACSRSTKIEKTPLTKQLDKLTNQILVIAGVALLASIGIGLARGNAVPDPVPDRRRLRRLGHPDRPAGGRHDHPVGRHDDAGHGRRHRQAPALGGDARLDLGHQLGQDRHAHPQPDDRGRRWRSSAGATPSRGEGYSTDGQDHPARPASRTCRSTRTCCRWRCAPTRWSRTATLVGDPTEGALVVLAAKGGVDPVLTREQYPRVAEVPFDAAYKFMATFHAMKDETGKDVIRCYVKGAPDQLLARASDAHGPDGATRADRPDARRRTWPRTSASASRACGSWRPAQQRLRPGDVRSRRRPAAARSPT